MRMIRLGCEELERALRGEIALDSLDLHPSGLVLGSFDGVHRGHQELAKALLSAKRRLGLKTSVLVTFRRHPRLLLGGMERPLLLTTWGEKMSLLEDVGIDVVVTLDFTIELACLDYRSFVRRFLVEWLGMTHLVAGCDVHLGKDRGGNAEALARFGEEIGYRLEVLPATTWRGREISSSGIRNALAAGDCADAAAMLGRPYAVLGRVCPGEGRGRKIGYPTANLQPVSPHKLLPAPGVYACRVQLPVDVIDESGGGLLGRVGGLWSETDRHGEMLATHSECWRLYGGMLNFGHVPTFHSGGLGLPRIEVHILDFAGDLRRRTIKVEWLRRLRDERRFTGVDALVAQLRQDESAARQEVLAYQRPDG